MRHLLLDQTPREHAVEAQNLSKRYSNGVHAVKGVTFAVPAGETFGLLGPPGAGKSTIIAMLSARILPTGRTARVAGFDVVKEAAQVLSLIGVQVPAVQDAGGSHRRAPARVHTPVEGSCDRSPALEKLHMLGVTTGHAFRIEKRIALPAPRHRADEPNAVIHREQLSTSAVTTRRPTIHDVHVQQPGKLEDVAAA